VVVEYARLALEVLYRARLDLTETRGKRRDDAYAFFFSPEEEPDLKFWCAVAGLSHTAVRRTIEATLLPKAA